MKTYYLLAGLVVSTVFFVSCNSQSEKKETDRDTVTASHDTTAHRDTVTTPANPMMEMHDAMAQMEQQMKSMSPTGDADYDFASMMKHHHEAAVRMAKAEIAGGTDEQMKQMAQKMLDAQQQEINQLNAFLQSATPTGNSDFGKKAMGMMTPMASMDMSSSTLDGMFASMMIPHHKDAIKMAKEYLKQAKNDTLRSIATNITRNQPKEIAELESWLKNKK